MITPQDTGKEAVVAFVATETERQASWSRLEGLLLHWACAAEAGGAWSMPPSGWKALIPGKSADAGGLQGQVLQAVLGGGQVKGDCLLPHWVCWLKALVASKSANAGEL